MRAYMPQKATFLICCVLSLLGCELSPAAGGYRSSMTAQNNARRDSLAVNSAVSAPSPTYHEIHDCEYEEKADFLNGIKTTSYVHLSIRKTGDKLLVAERNDDGKRATYLIGPTGKLYDFNITKLTESGRVTPENFGDLSSDDITRRSKEINPNNINEIELKFPFFKTQLSQSGENAADIHTEAGEVWASYVYRGATMYKGRMSFLYDLVRYVPTLNSMSVVGFLVFDNVIAAPLLVVLDSGSKYSFERLSCAN